MLKKIFQSTMLILVAGFSFFYTEKAIKIARNSDPIMVKINNAKKTEKVALTDPIIIDDEYITGINGCSVDEQMSYSKMKETGEYDENILVMKEEKIKKTTKNKYIISGNKVQKNVSIIFMLDNKMQNNLYNFIISKKIKSNFFLDGNIIENNVDYIKKISELGNIYNYGRNEKYNENYLIYDNNLIETLSNNSSKYCITNKKNKESLKLCNNYDMDMIKTTYIETNILNNIKDNLENGNIIAIFPSENNVDEIKVSINYILSKGYNLVTLDNLLDESNNCK